MGVQSAVILSSQAHPVHLTLGILWLALTVAAMLALPARARTTLAGALATGSCKPNPASR
jgi:hypothetical protein